MVVRKKARDVPSTTNTNKSPPKKEVGETFEEKEKRKALLKVWYAGQKNIEYDELVSKAHGLNGTEILEVLNYKPIVGTKTEQVETPSKVGEKKWNERLCC